jgi:DNA replication protein DnaC
VPLLVLDDLGVENSTSWVQEKLDTLVDYRLMHGLALVVTTNLTLEELPARISSRLERAGHVIGIKGEPYKSEL